MNKQLNIPSVELSSLSGIRNVYFVGIGGIGMSALARYCISRKINVGGYDRKRTKLTEELEKEGVAIHYTEDVSALPANIDLVVYTPAVPKEHAELTYFRNNNYRVAKRSDMLHAITNDSFNICVAGTHGKTTVSTMIAHILRNTGYGCTAFLGGISANYGTNFWSDRSDVCVIEADEYDRSFLKLNPDIAIITAMDADHLDIYGDEASMQEAFIDFGKKVKPGGVLISKFGLNKVKEIRIPNKVTYSLDNNLADIFASNIQVEEGCYLFDMQLKHEYFPGFRLNVGGMHNVENVIAAVAATSGLHINPDKIRSAVASYKGVKRRFEYIIPPQKTEGESNNQTVLIDDYAHHPEELKALLTSVRALFPKRWLCIIFQPHLFTRTRDFAEGFATSLSLADEVILLPIYPARELPISGITSELILDKIIITEKQLTERENLVKLLKKRHMPDEGKKGEVIVMAGAGDIDSLVNPVKEILN